MERAYKKALVQKEVRRRAMGLGRGVRRAPAARRYGPVGFIPSRGGATYARRMTRTEKKNIDQNVTLSGFGSATGSLTLLNACTAGGLPTNRVGRRIIMTSVMLRGRFQMAPTSTGTCSIRVIIFYDKQTNKSNPIATDLLVSDTIEALNLLANSHRFKILRDIIIPCVGTAGPQSAYLNEYIKIPRGCHEVEYVDGAGAGTVADITSGGLFALVYSDNLIGTASLSQNLNCRVRFTDT